MISPTAVRATEVEPVEMMPGAFRRTLAYGEHGMVCEVTLEAGSAVPMHQHPHEQVGYVVSGELTMNIAGTDYHFEPRDSYVIPGGVLHNATANVRTVVLDFFSPPREEYK